MAIKQGILFTGGRVKPLSVTGQFMPGAMLEFDLSGTLTLATIYSDGGLQSPLVNPVVAGSDGKFPAIYLDPSVKYRYRLFNNLAQLQEDVDPINYLIIGAASSTFTPVLTASSGQTTYTQNIGGYSVINNLLNFNMSISFSSIGTLSGPLFISGLPVASAQTPGSVFAASCAVYCSGLTTNNGAVVGLVSPQATQISLWHQTTSNNQILASDFAATGLIILSGTYPIF